MTDRKLTRVRGTRLFADVHQFLRLSAVLVAEGRRLAEALDDADPALTPFPAEDRFQVGWQATDLKVGVDVLERYCLGIAADLPEGEPLCEPSSLALPTL